jgi:hypothetical protein
MQGKLPPPDPFEPSGAPDRFEIAAPTSVFLNGCATRHADRVASAILTARPGLLVVCVPD